MSANVRYFVKVGPDGSPLADYRMTVDDETESLTVEVRDGDAWVPAAPDLVLGRLVKGDPLLVEVQPPTERVAVDRPPVEGDDDELLEWAAALIDRLRPPTPADDTGVPPAT